MVSAAVAMAALLGVLVLADAGAKQEETPEPGTSSSEQLGYVRTPLPGDALAQDQTLEVSRITLVGGESTDAYQHPGAAIYLVTEGELSIKISPTSATVRVSIGDPTVLVDPTDCSEGCEASLEADFWISFDQPVDIEGLEAVGEDTAVVYIISLTNESEAVFVTAGETERRLMLSGDSKVP